MNDFLGYFAIIQSVPCACRRKCHCFGSPELEPNACDMHFAEIA